MRSTPRTGAARGGEGDAAEENSDKAHAIPAVRVGSESRRRGRGGRALWSTAVFFLTPFRGWTVAPPRSTFACSCAARHKNVRVGCGSVVTHRVLCRQSTVMGTRRAVTLRGKQGRCAPPNRSGRLQ